MIVLHRNELMLTLYRIEKETGVAKKDDKKTKTEELNDFERQRFKVAEGVRMVRKVRRVCEKKKKKKKKKNSRQQQTTSRL
jgi:2-oxoglutarate dehydrogenase complex dehydrogenase (E1) component-like enzyme